MKNLLQLYKVVFILALLALSPIYSYAQNNNPEVTDLPPPKLVECKTPETCDRDPKHLEQFVKDFYNWYTENDRNYESQISKHSPDENMILGKNHKEKTDNSLKQILSANLYKTYIDKNAEFSSPDCQDKNINPIVCLFYPPAIWKGSIVVKTKEISGKSATLIVNMPEASQSYTSEILPANKLQIILNVEEGFWKIGKVSSNIRIFHDANTEQEKALANIISQANNDEYTFYNLFKNSNPNDEVFKKFDYSKILTKNFIMSVSEAEKKSVSEHCGGKYIDGELCGIGENPITCAQDTVSYFYKTIESNSSKAIIAASGLHLSNDVIKYIIVKDKKTWKIDGVDCGYEFKFNMD